MLQPLGLPSPPPSVLCPLIDKPGKNRGRDGRPPQKPCEPTGSRVALEKGSLGSIKKPTPLNKNPNKPLPPSTADPDDTKYTVTPYINPTPHPFVGLYLHSFHTPSPDIAEQEDVGSAKGAGVWDSSLRLDRWEPPAWARRSSQATRLHSPRARW